jgi:hypothetical protein
MFLRLFIFLNLINLAELDLNLIFSLYYLHEMLIVGMRYLDEAKNLMAENLNILFGLDLYLIGLNL